MLTLDEDIAMSVSRPLVLAVAALLVAGQVPDAGNPPAALTAAPLTHLGVHSEVQRSEAEPPVSTMARRGTQGRPRLTCSHWRMCLA
jgi:hypothetical protein